MTRRRRISERERLEIFLRHEGACHICGFKIAAGREPWDVEHIIPLALGGEDNGDNLAPAHRTCHAPKSAEDAGKIAKAKRNEKRTMGIRKQSSRPLPGGKDDEWKHTINRGWVRRDGG